jgi:hypothetical protein
VDDTIRGGNACAINLLATKNPERTNKRFTEFWLRVVEVQKIMILRLAKIRGRARILETLVSAGSTALNWMLRQVFTAGLRWFY